MTCARRLDYELSDLVALAKSEASEGGAAISPGEAAAIEVATTAVTAARDALVELRAAYKATPEASNAETVFSFLSKVRGGR